VAFPAQVSGMDYKLMANKEVKPLYTLREMAGAGIKADGELPAATLAMLLELEGTSANEYWVGLQNFYVITRYNRSPLYALAVFQLGEQIRTLYNDAVVSTKP
jgi:membrane-bound lytic murein transglycosylase B